MDDELKLIEILKVLWKGKWIILGVTGLALILSIVINQNLSTPESQSSLAITFNQDGEKYSNFDLMKEEIVSVNNFAELMTSKRTLTFAMEGVTTERSIDSIQDDLRIETTDQSLNVVLTGDNLDENEKIIVNIVNQTLQELEKQLIVAYESELSYYNNKMDSQLNQIRKTIKKYNENTDNKLPAFYLLNQQLLNTGGSIEIDAGLMESLTELTSQEQVDFIRVNTEINLHLKKYNEFLNQYSIIDQTTVDASIAYSHLINIPSETTHNAAPSPNRELNIFLGVMVGIILSIFIVFIRVYFKNRQAK
ncbi:Wzz/FepE/Etk N-terminal domain-containing protein [Aquibacillus halophilus]|nr:Wzz/FepE/Etk N-terminal domain-containing protein [Aquibacillus halophilus]